MPEKTQLDDRQTEAIIGAAMRVHGELGHGFLEQVYQEALEREFLFRKIPHEREKQINIFYRDEKMSVFYKADFVCFGNIVVELKAIADLGSAEIAQVVNYLRATKLPKALLLNFGAPSLQIRRLQNKLTKTIP